MAKEPHTKDQLGRGFYCRECSMLAKDYVEWPCSREKLVEVAVQNATYWQSVEHDEDLLKAFETGRQEGLKAKRSLKELIFGRKAVS